MERNRKKGTKSEAENTGVPVSEVDKKGPREKIRQQHPCAKERNAICFLSSSGKHLHVPHADVSIWLQYLVRETVDYRVILL